MQTVLSIKTVEISLYPVPLLSALIAAPLLLLVASSGLGLLATK